MNFTKTEKRNREENKVMKQFFHENRFNRNLKVIIKHF